MSKAVKKKARRLKRTIRRTLGTLFLISALVVAAIPVDNLQASNADGGIVALVGTKMDSVITPTTGADIPQISSSTPIYTNATNTVQFAYLPKGRGGYGAVIVGYSSGFLQNNTLDLTGKVDAYGQYRINDAGGTESFAAVGLSGNFLFYKLRENKTYTGTVTDPVKVEEIINLTTNPNFIREVEGQRKTEMNAQGIQVVTSLTVVEEVGNCLPCYVKDYDIWSAYNDNELYYYAWDKDEEVKIGEETDPNKFKKTTTPEFQRIKDASFAYISNQYITTGSDGRWTLGDTVQGPDSDVPKEQGIFAGQTNLYNFIVSKDFEGIGDYAFYNSGLREITLENGLTYIGAGAFENCDQLSTITLDASANVTKIGTKAFKGCSNLLSFVVPEGVVTIEDSAFEDCKAIRTIDLCSGLNENKLSRLGQNVFKGCSSLQSLTFPSKCGDGDTKDIYMSSFQGCTSLQFLASRNARLKFMDDDSFTYEDFKNQVTEEFYFEGLGNFQRWDNEEFSDSPGSGWDSEVHHIAWQENFAFSYLGYDSSRPDFYYPLNHYEKTVDAGGDAKNTFVVNPQNILERYKSTGTVKVLEIPNKIGRYSVSTIDARVFANKCTLEKVIIPSTVQAIGDEAFRGCHNLKDVIIDTKQITIGNDAFSTQGFSGNHLIDCGDRNFMEGATGQKPKSELHFIGTIASDSEPFKYAMSERGKYSNDQQAPSYIIFYSGSPDNLQVEYDPSTGKSVLMDFPSLDDYATGKYKAEEYVYLTEDYAAEALAAVDAYKQSGSTSGMTPQRAAIINSALNITIPDGVQAVKPGLFKKNEEENLALLTGAEPAAQTAYGMTVTAFSLEKIEGGRESTDPTTGEVTIAPGTGTFAGCGSLKSVTLNNDSAHPLQIDSHAFRNCEKLGTASMANVNSLGVRPFAGCKVLNSVNFQNSPLYICENSIIYGLNGNGTKSKVIECLEGRESRYIEAEEMAGITELAEEAFMGSGLRRVNLTASTIKSVPDYAFAETKMMQDIALPITCEELGDYVFKDSAVTFISIPCEDAFYVTENTFSDMAEQKKDVVIGCVPGSRVEQYADRNGFGKGDPTLGDRTYIIIFRDYVKDAGAVLEVDRQEIVGGKYVTPPTPNGREGQVFVGWQDEEGNLYTVPFEVSKDLTCTALYDVAGPDYGKLTVTFQNENGETIKNVYVVSGEDVDPNDIPNAPAKEGYTFTGWDRALTAVTESFSTRPLYKAVAGDECVVRYFVDGKVYYETTVKTGSDAPNITVEGKTGITWVPSLKNILKDTDLTAVYENDPDNPGPSPSPNPSPSPSPSPNPDGNGGNTGSSNTGSSNTVKHTLTVQGGSGSGSYTPGEQIIITANPPAKGQEFSSWTVSPANTVVTDKTLSSAIITMPNNDVAAIANYKAKTSTSTGTGNGSNTNSNRPGGGTGTVNGGSTVVIDKNGLSNTGVVSATVNGSSDNFVIKVTESSAATEAVLRALQAEYGSLDNVKYFPMDISLYDSTGTRLITDTTGLSVSITLPLPDSLITYAGNNKVAGVVNDRLDKLTPRFTTINGVACVTFTAEHFSPYVIYVDITNLSDGTISDNTPTTGDGIHPKWFLSIGLACLSFVMFMVKDNRRSPKKKQKVAVRA